MTIAVTRPDSVMNSLVCLPQPDQLVGFNLACPSRSRTQTSNVYERRTNALGNFSLSRTQFDMDETQAQTKVD